MQIRHFRIFYCRNNATRLGISGDERADTIVDEFKSVLAGKVAFMKWKGIPMRALFLAGVAVAAIVATGPATAADMQTSMYKAPMLTVLPSSWNGFYFGGHLGGGWGTKELGITLDNETSVFPANVNGFLGGVQGGYNYQTGWVVLGIEGDLSWADVKGAAFDSFFTAKTRACLQLSRMIAATNWTAARKFRASLS